MADYLFKFYERPARDVAARFVDQLPIEADGDAAAIAEARRAKPPFKNEWDFANLCDPEDTIIWRWDATDDEES